MEVSGLQDGKSFKVKKHVDQHPIKDPTQMTPLELSSYQKSRTVDEQANAHIRNEFNAKAVDNGMVEILVEAADGTALISGKKIDLIELGKAATEIALEISE